MNPNLHMKFKLDFPSPVRPWSLKNMWRLAACVLTLVALTGPAHATAVGPGKANPGVASVAPAGTKMVDGKAYPLDIARIKERDELVVAMIGVDNPPFFYERNGEIAGLEVDLAKDLAKELKVKVRFVREAKTFNEVVDMVTRQQADLGISKLSRTLTRAQLVHFSTPYLTLNHALILNRVAFARLTANTRLEDTIRNYKGTLGVIAKSSFADYATRNFPNAKLREFPNWNEVMSALNKGEVMAAYRDEFEIKRLLKLDPKMALTLRTVTLKDQEDTLSIAVGVGDATLLAFVNQFLAQRQEKLTIQKVLEAIETP